MLSQGGLSGLTAAGRNYILQKPLELPSPLREFRHSLASGPRSLAVLSSRQALFFSTLTGKQVHHFGELAISRRHDTCSLIHE